MVRFADNTEHFQSLVRAKCLYHSAIAANTPAHPGHFQSLVRAQCLYHCNDEVNRAFENSFSFNRSFALSASTTVTYSISNLRSTFFQSLVRAQCLYHLAGGGLPTETALLSIA